MIRLISFGLVFCFHTASTLHSADLLDLYYETQDGAITIIGCDGGAEGSLVIPEQIDGKPVKKIVSNAFNNYKVFNFSNEGDIAVINCIIILL